MIFITVGTTAFPFDRMVEAAKGLIKSRKKNETIIFQHGNTICDIREKNVFLYKSLPFPEMEQYIRQARIIVTHGGPATIYQTLAVGKTPYVLPREKRYYEHVDDHQVYFCRYLFNRHIIKLVKPPYSFQAQEFNKPIRLSSDKRLLSYLDATMNSYDI